MKKIKGVVEVIFIFFIPLLLLLTNVSVNRVNTNVVISGGNVESYDSTWSIVYDSSNLVYGVDEPISATIDYLGSTLGLNMNSDIVVFVINYTVLWFMMFCIWHVFYRLFDCLVHLIDKERG